MLDTVDNFMEEFVTAVEEVENPHDRKDLHRVIRQMSQNNLIRAKLPRYAAGTGFGKMITALSALSRTATAACTPQMAQTPLISNNAPRRPSMPIIHRPRARSSRRTCKPPERRRNR